MNRHLNFVKISIFLESSVVCVRKITDFQVRCPDSVSLDNREELVVKRTLSRRRRYLEKISGTACAVDGKRTPV